MVKIEHKVGNLLDVREGHIVHGCNAQGVMGSGVALAVKVRYPECYDDYHYHHLEHGLALGENIPWLRPDKKLVVWNAITQHKYGKSDTRYVSYDALERCFSAINGIIKLSLNESLSFYRYKDVPQHIHIPMIGAGLGGGNWEVIKTIIEQTVNYPVTLWTLE